MGHGETAATAEEAEVEGERQGKPCRENWETGVKACRSVAQGQTGWVAGRDELYF